MALEASEKVKPFQGFEEGETFMAKIREISQIREPAKTQNWNIEALKKVQTWRVLSVATDLHLTSAFLKEVVFLIL